MSLSLDGMKLVKWKTSKQEPLFLFCSLARCDCCSLSRTHTLVLLHSKCVSHGVTQLVGSTPSLLRLPFSSLLSIFGQKDVKGQRGCCKKGKAVIPWIAVLLWWSNSQNREGLEDISPSNRFFKNKFLNNGENYWRMILEKPFSWPTDRLNYIRWVIWNVAELDFT